MDEFHGSDILDAITAATHDHRAAHRLDAKARGPVERDRERRLERIPSTLAHSLRR